MLPRRPTYAAGAIAALLVAPGITRAEGRFAPWGPDPPLPPCTCRAQGQVFQMGETVCLRTPEGARIARCVMVINSPSWEATTTPCPQAGLSGIPVTLLALRNASPVCLRPGG